MASWAEAMDMIGAGQVDVLPAMVASGKRREIVTFTQPYITIPAVVYIREDYGFVDKFEDVVQGDFGLLSKTIIHENIQSDYPGARPHEFTFADGWF